MKHRKPGQDRAVGATMSEGSKLMVAVVLSLLGHLAFFALFISVPRLPFYRDLPSRVVTVDLVSLPAPRVKTVDVPEKPAPAKPEPKPVPPPPKPPEAKAPVKKAPPPPKAPRHKAISLAHGKRLQVESLKKKTFKSSRVVESAIKRIERDVRKSRPDPVKEALKHIRSAVQKEEAAGRSIAGTEARKKRALEMLDIYRVEIAAHIQKNWAYSEQMAEGQKDLSAWVMIEVGADGRIRDFWFEKRSGNAYLDESAERAVQKSNPLPPFPPGITDTSIHQGLRFTPRGIQ
jgi:colicin import membrane protein